MTPVYRTATPRAIRRGGATMKLRRVSLSKGTVTPTGIGSGRPTVSWR